MQRLLITLLAVCVFIACAVTVSAEEQYNVFVKDKIKIPVSGEGRTVFESVSPNIAEVDKEGVVTGVSAGETTINITTKRLFREAVKKEVRVKVYNEAYLTIKPREEITFTPKLVLYDEELTATQSFSPGKRLKIPPGTYYVKEETGYSIYADDYQRIDVAEGENKIISASFRASSNIMFKTEDESLHGRKVALWRKDGEGFAKVKTFKIKNNGETKKFTLHPGNYYWGEPPQEEEMSVKIKAPSMKPEKIKDEYKGKMYDVNIYPFGLSEKPLSIELRSVTASASSVAVEQVSLPESQSENTKKIYSDLTRLYGMSDVCACAIIGNMYGESGIRTGALENGGGGHGLCQWTGGRWTNLKNYADQHGRDWTDIEIQIDFLMKELSGMNMDEFWGSANVEEATELFMRKFERPAEWVYPVSLPKRIGAAKRAMETFSPESEI